MQPIANVDDLETALSTPTSGVLETLSRLSGDVMVLGSGGKMGPTLVRMLGRAKAALGDDRNIFAVSRYSSVSARQSVEQSDAIPIPCDLSNRAAVASLPEAPLILYLAGQKFGTSDHPEQTWVMNTLVPAIVAERFPASRIVVFSTGCVYALAPSTCPPREDGPLQPPGEYANTCLGRERIFTHFSIRNQTPMLLFRLNYAIDLRYGVLLDIGQKVYARQPVDVSMGSVNFIWQADANARAIQCLELTQSPPAVLNVTSREVVSVRSVAMRFGEIFGTSPQLVGSESPTAWLSDASRSYELFGPPEVSIDEMILATADWIAGGGVTLNKPTHFESRDGKF